MFFNTFATWCHRCVTLRLPLRVQRHAYLTYSQFFFLWTSEWKRTKLLFSVTCLWCILKNYVLNFNTIYCITTIIKICNLLISRIFPENKKMNKKRTGFIYVQRHVSVEKLDSHTHVLNSDTIWIKICNFGEIRNSLCVYESFLWIKKMNENKRNYSSATHWKTR